MSITQSSHKAGVEHLWLRLIIKIMHLNSPSFPADNSCISAWLFIASIYLLFYRLLKVMVNSEWKAQGYKKLFNKKCVGRNWTCEKCREMPVCCIHLLMGITVLSFVTLLCFGMYLPYLGIFNDINHRLGQVCHSCSSMVWQAVQAWSALQPSLGSWAGCARALCCPEPRVPGCLVLPGPSTGSKAGLQLLCSLICWPGPAHTDLTWRH